MTLSDLQPGEHFTRLLQKRWLVWLVNGLLALWLAWIIGNDVWELLYPEPESVATPAPVTSPDKPEPHVSADELANWHLFGTATEEESTSASSPIINAPETKLKLTLRGIIAETDKHKGYAIIQKTDKQEEHFGVGDSIFGLATLEEIYVGRVVILRKGQYETLTLPIEALVFEILADKIKKDAEKETMSTWRKKFLGHKSYELSKLFGFDTAYRNGGFFGWEVKSLSEEGDRMLETLGLENGDLITAVNGKRFAESLEATKSLEELKTATEVDIEVERDGVPMFFHLDFDDEELVDAPTEETRETLTAEENMDAQPEEETNSPETEQ